MDKIIQLFSSDNKIIKIKIVNELNWCEVSLNTNGKEYYLGAETFKKICDRLLMVFESKSFQLTNFEIEGEKVFWILSLSETHTCMYGVLKDKFVLYIVKDGGEISDKIEISDTCKNEWIEKLNDFEITNLSSK